jgi:hypothetical protein
MITPATNLGVDANSSGAAAQTSHIEGEVFTEFQVDALRDRHRTMLYFAVVAIAAAFLLRIRDSESVSLRGLHMTLPTLCGSRALFGVDCPGCGLTRSIIALAAGDLSQSLQFHRVGWLMALAIVAQVPYRMYALRELRTRPVHRVWPIWFGYFLIAALVISWLWKIVA